MGKLNPKQVENLAKPGTYEDGDGLRLVVKANGTKSWVIRFQLDGKRREMGLGAFPAVNLKGARLAAIAKRELLRQRIDPLAHRDEQIRTSKLEAQQRLAKSVTFRSIATDYIEAHRTGWKNAKHAQQWENTLKTYAYPVLEHLTAEEITTEHVLKVLKPIWQVKAETASRVRNRIEMVLDAAKARELRNGENPARWRGHLDKLLPARGKIQTVVHHPALPWLELPAFMKLVTAREELSCKAICLTILTACRTSEVLGATWAEVDIKNRVWKIPAARMKAGKEQRVPLSLSACAIIKGLRRFTDSDFVFPGAKAGSHLSNTSMLMALRRMNRSDLTMHGFRSTFRDWAAESTSYPREVCEQALAHNRQDKAEAAYFRTDLFDKRRAMMEEWATYSCSIKADE
jgi:integrase